MKKTDSRQYLSLILVSAAVYLVADLPVQLTGFLRFGSWIGIKNFLPVTLGLFLGPCGVAGGMLGCVVTAIILQTPLGEAAFECLCIAVIGIGMWLLWHTRNDSHRICFKQPIQYLWYAGLLLGLSAVCGLISLLVIENAFWPTVAAYTALGLLVGLPVNIILGGLFCLSPVLPPFCRIQNDVIGTIGADAEGLDPLNEMLEERAGSCHISRKRVFEVQNCIEEVALRILRSVPDAQIRLTVDYSDAISIRFAYSGGKTNPLRTGKEEDEVDLMSLKLIKHRALRVMYSYNRGENHLHIVI